MGDIITAIDPKFMEHSLLVCKEDIQKYARFGKMLIDLEWWNSYFMNKNGTPQPDKYSTPHDCCLWSEENNCCKAGQSNCPDNDNCYMFD